MRFSLRAVILGAFVCSVLVTPRLVRADATQRIQMSRLKALHQAIEELAQEHKPVALDDGFEDYRASMHVHSHHSHDSNAPLEEVVAGAKEAGVRVVMFNDHPADSYDYFTDGHRGMVDGVLLVAGAETEGFLAYPTRSIQAEQAGLDGPQPFCDLVRRDDGMVFLSHLEQRLDWDIRGMTGTEIYNTHADLMEEKRLLGTLRSPLALLGLLPALEQYPQEVFGSIQDYPTDYLARWDELCQTQRLTGVAANDAHHNQSIRAVMIEGDKVEILDALDKKLATLDAKALAFLGDRIKGKQSGDVVMKIDLDPYPRSLGHVSTHLLMNAHTEASVHEALKAGRAYVSFDWLGDPTGFVYQGHHTAGSSTEDAPGTKPKAAIAMGSELAYERPIKLEAATPLPALIKVVRNGEVVHETRARAIQFEAEQPGVYRVEAWLPLAGELRPWILSNPIYLREKP
jgi:hypothetical protein